MKIIPLNITYQNNNCAVKKQSQKNPSFCSKSNLIQTDYIRECLYDAKRAFENARKNYNSAVGSEQVDAAFGIARAQDEYSALRKLFETAAKMGAKGLATLDDFFKNLQLMGADMGFNKIIGHDDIKKQLTKEFAINTILKSRISDDVKVPNAILFFGLTGCGKTYFATALAEQSQCECKKIRVDRRNILRPERILNEIEPAAEKSRQTYLDTGKRTMIVLDEANKFLYDNSPALNEFMNFVKDCSDKYKCTMFLTTNEPFDISLNILSRRITPLKIPVHPPTIDDIGEFIRRKTHAINPNFDEKDIVYSLKKRGGPYSYSTIQKMIEQATVKDPFLEDDDCLFEILHRFQQLDKESLEKFKMQCTKLPLIPYIE